MKRLLNSTSSVGSTLPSREPAKMCISSIALSPALDFTFSFAKIFFCYTPLLFLQSTIYFLSLRIISKHDSVNL